MQTESVLDFASKKLVIIKFIDQNLFNLKHHFRLIAFEQTEPSETYTAVRIELPSQIWQSQSLLLSVESNILTDPTQQEQRV